MSLLVSVHIRTFLLLSILQVGKGVPVLFRIMGVQFQDPGMGCWEDELVLFLFSLLVLMSDRSISWCSLSDYG